MRTANDNAFASCPTRGAGRDVRKALATMGTALAAGNLGTVRNAARYAFPRLLPGMALPQSDAVDVWIAVLRVLNATADIEDRRARAARAAFAGIAAR